jgi:hypothetical protein
MTTDRASPLAAMPARTYDVLDAKKTVFVISPSGLLHEILLPVSTDPRRSRLEISQGWRYASKRDRSRMALQPRATCMASATAADAMRHRVDHARQPSAHPIFRRAEQVALTQSPISRQTLIDLNAIANPRRPFGSAMPPGPMCGHAAGWGVGDAPGYDAVDFAAELEYACDFVNVQLAAGRYLHAAAYTWWRVSWLHAFPDANGRTARAAAYLCLLLGLQHFGAFAAAHRPLTGREHLLVPERMERDRPRWTRVLRDCNGAYRPGVRHVDLSRVEDVLRELAADQVAGRASREATPFYREPEWPDSAEYPLRTSR